MFRSTVLIIACSIALAACGEKEKNSAGTKIASPEVAPAATSVPTDIGASETAIEDDYDYESQDDIEESTIVISEEEMPVTQEIEEEYSNAVEEVAVFEEAVTDAGEVEVVIANEDIVYTVQAGDVLSTIARKHNTTVDAIVSKNRLSDPNSIAVGQQLLID